MYFEGALDANHSPAPHHQQPAPGNFPAYHQPGPPVFGRGHGTTDPHEADLTQDELNAMSRNEESFLTR